MNGVSLRKIDAADRVLANAKNLEEVIQVYDVAKAALAYYKAKKNRGKWIEWTGGKLTAERRAGQFYELAPEEKSGPRNSHQTGESLTKGKIRDEHGEGTVERWQNLWHIQPEERFLEFKAKRSIPLAEGVHAYYAGYLQRKRIVK